MRDSIFVEYLEQFISDELETLLESTNPSNDGLVVPKKERFQIFQQSFVKVVDYYFTKLR